MGDKIYVLLGCWGRQDNGFVSCSSVENRILCVTTAIEHYNDILDYFEACRLFDKPLFEQSPIKHFIFNMQQKFDQVASSKRLWTEQEFQLYQKFLIDHRLCGTYVKLSLVDDEHDQYVQHVPEKGVFIKSQKDINEKPEETVQKLRLVRR